MNDVEVVCSFGDPGAKVSATFSPLDRCEKIDVGKMVWQEVNSWVVHNAVDVEHDTNRVYFNKGARGGQ